MNCESVTDRDVKNFLSEMKMLFDAFAKAYVTVDPQVPEGVEGRAIARPKITPELCREVSAKCDYLIKEIDCENY